MPSQVERGGRMVAKKGKTMKPQEKAKLVEQFRQQREKTRPRREEAQIVIAPYYSPKLVRQQDLNTGK